MRNPSIFLLAASAAILTAGPASAGDASPRPTQLHGRCEYGDQVAEYLGPANGFAQCDTVVIDDGSIDFRQQSFGSVVRYEGRSNGDKMTIRRVDLPKKSPKAAEGSCTIYRNEGRISAVTCIALAGRLSYSANFIPDA